MITFLEILYYAISIPIGIVLTAQVLGCMGGMLFGDLVAEVLSDGSLSPSSPEENVPHGLPPERSAEDFQIDDSFGF